LPAQCLLGSYGHKGGMFISQGIKIAPYPLPKYPSTPNHGPTVPKAEQYPFADEGITTSIRDATLSAKPYPIKGWFVYSTNLMQALPNEAETIKAIQKLDLLVVCDTMPSEMAGWADVILPDTTFLERHDELLTGYGRNGWASLRQPVVAAPHDQKPAWWIAKQLAEKLGVGDCMPFKDMEEYLSFRVEKSGHSWEKLKKEGVILAEHKPITVEEGLDAGFEHAQRQGRVLVGPAGREGLRRGAQVHQASRSTRRPLPADHRPRAGPHLQPHADQPLLHDLMPENEIWVNAATAAAGAQEP
jgi:thiosulfate reductase/polysulfide reductase chain A